MVNLLHSEWHKLVTTRSFYWTTAFIVVFSLAWAAMNGVLAIEPVGGFGSLLPGVVVMGLYQICFAVIIIQAVMMVSTEYRYRTTTPTFLGSPKRWQVAAVKLGLYAVFVALLVLATVVASFVVADLTANPKAAELFSPFSDHEGQRILYAYPVAAVGVAMMGQGVAWLLRSTAGAVTLMLVWFYGLEQLVKLTPEFGPKVAPYLPFHNLAMFIRDMQMDVMPWGPMGSLGVFYIWVVVIWLAGVVSLSVRDV